jgi:hypothetical protein
VSQHFVSPGHSLEDFGRSKIYIIDHNPSWKESQRQKKEREVNHIRCFAIDIAKYLILLSCRLAMEHLCVLQLETALATLGRRKCPTIQQKNEWTQKWPYEKDALARKSTLCVAGALIGWLWQIQNLYHWPQSKLERKSKTMKREFLDVIVT